MIVGFPGETETDFRELYEFVKAAEFDRLGVFAYSDEEQTVRSSGKVTGQSTRRKALMPDSAAHRRRNRLIDRGGLY
jgi:tRNA A37 methylthiotransferase MiaB